MTPDQVKEFLELAAFAWGIYSWVLSRRDKRVIQDREDFKAALSSYELQNSEKFREQKDGLKDLEKTVIELQKQMASLQAKVEGLDKTSKLAVSSIEEYSKGVSDLIITWDKRLGQFGKVILKE